MMDRKTYIAASEADAMNGGSGIGEYAEFLGRIRARMNDAPMETEHMLDDAADAIKTLQAKVDKLREALERIAGRKWNSMTQGCDTAAYAASEARKALEETR